MRLFIAINFSSELKKDLDELAQALKAQALQGTFTEKDNYHLTLVFIGETTRVKDITKIIDQTEQEQFSLKFGNLGFFPRPEGRIYWVGIEDNPALYKIQERLVEDLNNHGFAVDDRKYKPHITLGRRVILKEKGEPQIVTEQLKAKIIPVEKISLMKSERIAGKLIYTEIYSKTLAFN